MAGPWSSVPRGAGVTPNGRASSSPPRPPLPPRLRVFDGPPPRPSAARPPPPDSLSWGVCSPAATATCARRRLATGLPRQGRLTQPRWRARPTALATAQQRLGRAPLQPPPPPPPAPLACIEPVAAAHPRSASAATPYFRLPLAAGGRGPVDLRLGGMGSRDWSGRWQRCWWGRLGARGPTCAPPLSVWYSAAPAGRLLTAPAVRVHVDSKHGDGGLC